MKYGTVAKFLILPTFQQFTVRSSIDSVLRHNCGEINRLASTASARSISVGKRNLGPARLTTRGG